MGTPLQAVERAAQPCSPSSSLVLLPQRRGTRGPSLAGSSQVDQPRRRTIAEAGSKAAFDSPTSEIFIPEGKGTDICINFAHIGKWQHGPGVSYNSKSCSEGCCFYTPASSKRVQEIEAEVEKNLPTWFRTPAGGCDDVPSSTTT